MNGSPVNKSPLFGSPMNVSAASSIWHSLEGWVSHLDTYETFYNHFEVVHSFEGGWGVVQKLYCIIALTSVCSHFLHVGALTLGN